MSLIVDDDVRLARQTARFLESHGVVVLVVADGRSGQLEVSRSAYDCVVLDLMLPDRDGLDVCRALRVRSRVPIIFVTGRGTEDVCGVEAGADHYMTKPFS